MKKALLFGIIGATAITLHAHAEVDPTAGAHDSRVRYVAYDPINVTKVVTSDLRSTLVQFADDETIDVFALGDTAAWSYTFVRNLLFIRPIIALPRPTNAQVVTLKKDGTQRIYQMFFTAGDAPTASFGVNFAYPGDIAEARRKAAAEKAAKADAEKAEQRLQTAYFMGVRNWSYVGRGSASIEPSEISDNGETTIFRFPGNTKQPAIYEIAPDGKEQIASTTNDSDLVIAHTIARGWRLRLGAEVYDIWNVGFNAVGENPRTGTTSPEVVRTVKTGDRH